MPRRDPPVLAAIAVGGILGAEGRYGVDLWLPTRTGGMPWATLGINLSGSLLIGVLMVAITEARRPHRLIRPFLGLGVLGGFTTFSSYAVEIRHLAPTSPGIALSYLALTLAGGLLAVAVGASGARLAIRGGPRLFRRDPPAC